MRNRIASLLVFLCAVTASVFAQQRAQVYVDPVDLVQLKAECLTNPNNYSYTDPGAGTKTLQQWFLAGDDVIVAKILNETRAGITIYRTDVTPDEVKEAVAVADLSAGGATAANASVQSAWLNAFFSGSSVRLLTRVGGNTRALNNLLALMTNGSQSENRVKALGSRTGTRAEQLWGCVAPNTSTGCEYVTVSQDHVRDARQLP